MQTSIQRSKGKILSVAKHNGIYIEQYVSFSNFHL